MAHKIGSTDKKVPHGYLAFVSKGGHATAVKAAWKKGGPKKIQLGGHKVDKKKGKGYFVKGKGIFEMSLKNQRKSGKKKSSKKRRGKRK